MEIFEEIGIPKTEPFFVNKQYVLQNVHSGKDSGSCIKKVTC